MNGVALLAEHLKRLNIKMATAESCTGGLIAKQCTDLAGSSAWFDCGFITYSNQAKIKMLNVDSQMVESNGAVSQVTAEAMAVGALVNSDAQISVAVTGIAGPGGGTDNKPVGTVWIAWAQNHLLDSCCYLFDGSRHQVRTQTASEAIKGLIERVSTLS